MSRKLPASPLPLADLRFCLAGAGRVGESLAGWLTGAGACLTAVAGRGREGAETSRRAGRVAERYGGRAEPLAALGGGGEDLLLVAVSDPALEEVAEALSGHRRAEVALHTSGRHGASVLAPLAAAGTAGGSLHPLRAFPRPLPEAIAASGVVFAVDGDLRALDLGRRLARALGGVPVEVPEGSRLLYHFAATLAAGGVVTLVALATAIGERLGLGPEVARGYLELARGALAEVEPERPAEAITGPVARGDAAAVTAALGVLGEVCPEALPTALQMARETLRQLAEAGPLDAEQEHLRGLLDKAGQALTVP